MPRRPVFGSARISPRWLGALRLLSAVDLILLVALVYAALEHRDEAVDLLGPAHGVLFLLLVAGVAAAARQRWWSWRFVAAVLILGPLASVPGLEHYARDRW